MKHFDLIKQLLSEITVDLETGIIKGKRGEVISSLNSFGYKIFYCRKDGKKYVILQHQIIAVAGGLVVPEGFTIDHINGKKTDNRLENLEAVSRTENIRRAWRAKGIDVEAVLERVRELKLQGLTHSQISREVNVTRQHIDYLVQKGVV
jgi:hypothetical protein